MSFFRFEALKAYNGDCLILRCGVNEMSASTVLIDGGAGQTYDDFLKNRLIELNEKTQNPVIDLMMLSHIDADHVKGLLDLTNELIEADQNQEFPLVEVKQLWHNAFDDVIGEAEPFETLEQSSLKTAKLIGSSPLLLALRGGGDLVLASVGQGRRLKRDADRLNIPVNEHWDGQLILFSEEKSTISVGGLKFKIIGPSQTEVDRLRDQWRKNLIRIHNKESGLSVELASKSLDTSISNLASLVMIAQYEGKTVLLTGDARGDSILRWLSEQNQLNDSGILEVDVFKMPHHGSYRNMTPEVFSKIRAKHYVFSGNGRHGNPEPKTMEMLLDSRDDDDEFYVYFTYSVEEMALHLDFSVDIFQTTLTDHRNSKKMRLCYPAPGKSQIEIDL